MAPWRAALLFLPLLALACGGGGNKPPVKDPPLATLSVPQPNTVGQKLTVQVSATGCDQIQSLSIWDRGTDKLKDVAYSGSGAVPVELASTEIKYTRGIAAQLSLTARVVCADGRQGESQPQPATFFPVAEVIEPPAGSGLLVVPEYFIAEGQGGSVTFIGCGNDTFGAAYVFRVTKTGPSTAYISKAMPRGHVCDHTTSVTGVDPSSRKRWVWTPGVGAFAVDEQLNITGQTPIQLESLSVGPGGDALIYDNALGVLRMSHETGEAKWRYLLRGPVIAPVLVRANLGVVLVPQFVNDDTPGYEYAIGVATVDYSDQLPTDADRETGYHNLVRLTAADSERIPPAAFNTDGSLLYVALAGNNNLSEVLACSTAANGCEEESLRWKSPYLPGPVVALIPYANGGRVAAVAPQFTWFINSISGLVMNKNLTSLSPEGALVTLQVQPGAGAFPEAFYLLNGPPRQEGLPTPQPLEIVGVDSAEKGELIRYQVTAGSLSSAVDYSGTLWLRINEKLVRPLSPAEYRQVRPESP